MTSRAQTELACLLIIAVGMDQELIDALTGISALQTPTCSASGSLRALMGSGLSEDGDLSS
jgi:hypothetical protein